MRVRVKYKTMTTMEPKYCIQVWRWWWPRWTTVDYWGSLDVALAYAKELKHPSIKEIT